MGDIFMQTRKMVNNYTIINKFYMSVMQILMLCFCFSLPLVGLHAAPSYDSKILKVELEDKMLVSKTYRAVIEIKNTGAESWSSRSDITLEATEVSSRSWGISPVRLNEADFIKPGQTKTFVFNIDSPSGTGIYDLQFQLKRSGQAFGEASKKMDIVLETPNNRVKFISQLLPDTMNTGQEYTIVVQYKNNGSSTWDSSDGYRLGMLQGSNTWNQSQISLDKNAVVATGNIATFRFTVQAPETPGIYPMQWQMQIGRRWFGEPTPLQNIKVMESASSSGAEFVYQDIPGLQKIGELYTIFERGNVYPVTITFKNTSEEPWTEGHFSLNAQNPANSLTWSVDRVDLKKNEVIKPGQIKTFSFKVIAPLTPGIYNFQWQMVMGFNSWVGEKSENVSITVR